MTVLGARSAMSSALSFSKMGRSSSDKVMTWPVMPSRFALRRVFQGFVGRLIFVRWRDSRRFAFEMTLAVLLCVGFLQSGDSMAGE
jgi:hypothetical protein